MTDYQSGTTIGMQCLHFRFQMLYQVCREPCHFPYHHFIHTLSKHLLGNFKTPLCHTFLETIILESFLYAYRIPELIVSSEFCICKAGNLQVFYCFSNFRVIKKFSWDFFCIGIYLCQESEPQHHHTLVTDRMGSEFRKFYEGKMQAFYYLITVLVMHNAIIMNEIRSIALEDIIHKVEGIYGLQSTVFFSLYRLTDIEFGCIEQNSLLESFRPLHLHFHAEFPSSGICAKYVHKGVLVAFKFGHKFCRQILYLMYLLFFAKWQECIQKTNQSLWMIAEYLLKRDICLWV